MASSYLLWNPFIVVISDEKSHFWARYLDDQIQKNLDNESNLCFTNWIMYSFETHTHHVDMMRMNLAVKLVF